MEPTHGQWTGVPTCQGRIWDGNSTQIPLSPYCMQGHGTISSTTTAPRAGSAQNGPSKAGYSGEALLHWTSSEAWKSRSRYTEVGLEDVVQEEQHRRGMHYLPIFE